ncbi:Astacin-like metalloendopeptidase [Strongyloides ratti]|uniref:Metalloendopeptidase n=1 Tax=Strongyloides ratti TaxID=34506 RepID=A0A090LQN7_STRRB|nr:Astacin-like metalloendopeptidase [Strongyloides ratti]CEF69891.1 Astacin-like metalloendopeptidase [Strongyloides ratti]
MVIFSKISFSFILFNIIIFAIISNCLIDVNSYQRNKRSIVLINHKFVSPIPYYIGPFTKNYTSIHEALYRIQNNTCIRFKPAIFYVYGTGGFNFLRTHTLCESSSGPKLGDEKHINYVYISENCEHSIGKIEQLVGKMLGLVPEIYRDDRNKYVQINYSNLDKRTRLFYKKASYKKNDTMTFGYDFLSGTHFYAKNYSVNGKVVIEPKKPYEYYKYSMGQPYGLSFSDIKLLNKKYCFDIYRKNHCKNNGYRNPNNPKKCLCPSGFAGSKCEKQIKSSSACGTTFRRAWSCVKQINVKGIAKCSYFIKSLKNKRVKIIIDKSETEPNEHCYKNMGVEIKYRDNKGVSGVCLCGSYSNLTFISENNFAVVVYHGFNETNRINIRYQSVTKSAAKIK